MKRFLIGLVFVLLVAWPVLTPLTKEGFFSMHDDTQVARVIEMGKSLRDGQFPVRWVSDLGYGYGYPIYNFYAPLPYYFGGALFAFGVPSLIATKLMFAVGIIFAVVSMYMLLSNTMGISAAIIGSILYLYAPYHAVQIYIRGAVGEFWSYAIIPLFVWGIFLAAQEKRRIAIFVLSLSVCTVITAHTITGYFMVLVGVVFGLAWFCIRILSRRIPRPAVIYSAGLGVGLLLSCFFWFPAMMEKGYTNVAAQIGPTARYWEHFVCVWQLWDSPWGFAGSAPGCIDGVSFRLGKLHILMSGIAVLIWLSMFLKKKGKKMFYFPWWAVTIGIVALFFLLPISKPIWLMIPNGAYIQYPWRLLGIVSLALSVVGAYFFVYIDSVWWKRVGIVIAVFCIVFLYSKLFVPQKYTYTSSNVYETDEELRYRVSRVSDEYMPKDFVKPYSVDQIVRGTIEPQVGLTVVSQLDTVTEKKYRILSDVDRTVRVNIAYFPGWRFTVEGKQVVPTIDKGLPYVAIPAGATTLEIVLKNTYVRYIANIISSITWVIFLIYYGKNKKINA